MNFQHKTLVQGKWAELQFVEQMANIGTEVGRAIRWQEKGNPRYKRNALYRALELIDLTIAFNDKPSRFKELTRMRELLIDYFLGENRYASTPELWQKYFYPFNYAARKHA